MQGQPEPIIVGGVSIGPGEQATVDLPVARLHTHTELQMPVHVVRGRHEGPVLFVSGAIHGDELNGVEIIRRLLRLAQLRRLRGTLLAVPVVNVFGLLGHSRYLPDRRDLNRSFPGFERGSLAGRLAHLFMTEVVAQSTHGIDLHTGGVHRTNLPQVRVDFGDGPAFELAKAFGAPVVLDASLREGSLRAAVAGEGVAVILYEGGEALRLDGWAIRAGLRGVVGAMQHLGMLPPRRPTRRAHEPLVAIESRWVRAPSGGIFRPLTRLGQVLVPGQLLGVVGDPYGREESEVRATSGGLIIGQSNLPLVNEGDALCHVAWGSDAAVELEPIDPFEGGGAFPAGDDDVFPWDAESELVEE